MHADTKALIDALNRIRLDEDRSYADLAAGIGMDPGGLYKILNENSEPYDRTIHKMRRFLEKHDADAARRPRKKAVA